MPGHNGESPAGFFSQSLNLANGQEFVNLIASIVLPWLSKLEGSELNGDHGSPPMKS